MFGQRSQFQHLKLVSLHEIGKRGRGMSEFRSTNDFVKECFCNMKISFEIPHSQNLTYNFIPDKVTNKVAYSFLLRSNKAEVMSMFRHPEEGAPIPEERAQTVSSTPPLDPPLNIDALANG